MEGQLYLVHPCIPIIYPLLSSHYMFFKYVNEWLNRQISSNSFGFTWWKSHLHCDRCNWLHNKWSPVVKHTAKLGFGSSLIAWSGISLLLYYLDSMYFVHIYMYIYIFFTYVSYITVMIDDLFLFFWNSLWLFSFSFDYPYLALKTINHILILHFNF